MQVAGTELDHCNHIIRLIGEKQSRSTDGHRPQIDHMTNKITLSNKNHTQSH